jgi:predicted MFS family arabinose efflux permease
MKRIDREPRWFIWVLILLIALSAVLLIVTRWDTTTGAILAIVWGVTGIALVRLARARR